MWDSQSDIRESVTNLRADRICVHHLFQACQTTQFIRTLNDGFTHTMSLCKNRIHFQMQMNSSTHVKPRRYKYLSYTGQ